MAKSPGRTDRKTEVLNAAAGLFVANVYMSTTMDDIATAVSLNKGTLYYYYDSKASILFDIVNRLEQGRVEAARALAAELGRERTLREFIEDSAVYIMDHPRLLRHVADYAEVRRVPMLESISAADNWALIELERSLGFTCRPLPDDPSLVLLQRRFA